MNVTLKLPDEMVREARHLALDENKSLSGLVFDLLDARLKERTGRQEATPSLIETLMLPDAPEWFYEKDFPLPDRKEDLSHREIDFGSDKD